MTWPDHHPASAAAGAGRYGAPGTGHPEVDAVIAGLADLGTTPLEEQVARYTEAHRALQQTLRTIDET